MWKILWKEKRITEEKTKCNQPILCPSPSQHYRAVTTRSLLLPVILFEILRLDLLLASLSLFPYIFYSLLLRITWICLQFWVFLPFYDYNFVFRCLFYVWSILMSVPELWRLPNSLLDFCFQFQLKLAVGLQNYRKRIWTFHFGKHNLEKEKWKIRNDNNNQSGSQVVSGTSSDYAVFPLFLSLQGH